MLLEEYAVPAPHVTPVMLLLQQTISLTHSKLTQQKREDGGNLSPEIKKKVYSLGVLKTFRLILNANFEAQKHNWEEIRSKIIWTIIRKPAFKNLTIGSMQLLHGKFL
jgi:hypothetical protein